MSKVIAGGSAVKSLPKGAVSAAPQAVGLCPDFDFAFLPDLRESLAHFAVKGSCPAKSGHRQP